MTVAKAASKLHIAYSTVWDIVRRYRNNNNTLVEKPYEFVGRRPKLTAEFMNHIGSRESLVAWVNLNLVERCAKIKEIFGVSISPDALNVAYGRLNIR